MSHNSGKLLILAMLLVGLLAAGTSWWFRYSATHRAAKFWGPQAARLIRESPKVELLQLELGGGGHSVSGTLRLADEASNVLAARDVSTARGMTHLRTALLENRSFDSFRKPADQAPKWRWALRFHDHSSATILFNEDCTATTAYPSEASRNHPSDGVIASCEPIAAGLREVFAEWAESDIGAAGK